MLARKACKTCEKRAMIEGQLHIGNLKNTRNEQLPQQHFRAFLSKPLLKFEHFRTGEPVFAIEGKSQLK